MYCRHHYFIPDTLFSLQPITFPHHLPCRLITLLSLPPSSSSSSVLTIFSALFTSLIYPSISFSSRPTVFRLVLFSLPRQFISPIWLFHIIVMLLFLCYFLLYIFYYNVFFFHSVPSKSGLSSQPSAFPSPPPSLITSPFSRI